MNVLLQIGEATDKEMVANTPVTYDGANNIYLQPLIENIKAKGFPGKNHLILYKDN